MTKGATVPGRALFHASHSGHDCWIGSSYLPTSRLLRSLSVVCFFIKSCAKTYVGGRNQKRYGVYLSQAEPEHAMPVQFTAKALKDLRSMPAKDSTAIVAKLEAFSATGAGDVKKLQDCHQYRLRHGDWRALFEMAGEIIVVRVLHLSQAYDRVRIGRPRRDWEMHSAKNLQGEELIVLTRSEFADLIEDAGDAALIVAARREGGATMPADLALQVLDGLHPLTAWRKAAGLTQADLADRAGVRVATVSDIESGKIDPRMSTVVALATALGVGVGDLVK